MYFFLFINKKICWPHQLFYTIYNIREISQIYNAIRCKNLQLKIFLLRKINAELLLLKNEAILEIFNIFQDCTVIFRKAHFFTSKIRTNNIFSSNVLDINFNVISTISLNILHSVQNFDVSFEIF